MTATRDVHARERGRSSVMVRGFAVALDQAEMLDLSRLIQDRPPARKIRKERRDRGKRSNLCGDVERMRLSQRVAHPERVAEMPHMRCRQNAQIVLPDRGNLRPWVVALHRGQRQPRGLFKIGERNQALVPSVFE